MKYIVHLNDLAMIEPLITHNVTAITIGTQHYSSGGILACDIAQIESIVKQVNKRMMIYILVNRLFHEHELTALENFLNQLQDGDIDGVIFQDFAVLNMMQSLKVSYQAIYAPDTLNTNHQTLNTLGKLGVEQFILAGQLHYDEVEAIVKNSDKKCIVPIHGVQYVSCSRRSLLTNYYEQIKKVEKTDYLTQTTIKVHDKDEYSYIYEDEAGTHIYTTKELCSLDLQLPADYGYIETLFLENDYILDVVDYYQNSRTQADLMSQYPDHLYDHGFFEDGTVYKIEDVRKREENEKH